MSAARGCLPGAALRGALDRAGASPRRKLARGRSGAGITAPLAPSQAPARLNTAASAPRKIPENAQAPVNSRVSGEAPDPGPRRRTPLQRPRPAFAARSTLEPIEARA